MTDAPVVNALIFCAGRTRSVIFLRAAYGDHWKSAG